LTIVRVEPAQKLHGDLRPPTDKSISHRAAILGAMAAEPVRIRGYLDAADTNSTLRAVQRLGALVQVGADEVLVRGTGLRDAAVPEGPIDVGNAGTLMRLLPGWLAAQEGRSYTLDGDVRRSPSKAPTCDRSTTSCRWPARRSSRACCSPPWPPTEPPRSPSRRPAATTPSACWPPPA
jgi:hypothetical protein